MVDQIVVLVANHRPPSFNALPALLALPAFSPGTLSGLIYA